MTTGPNETYSEIPMGMKVAGPTIAILILLLGILAFVLFLLLHGEHRRQLSVQLAASIMVAHLIIALFIHPASIQIVMMRKPITYGYCWFFVFLYPTAVQLVPYTLLMFTIERLMYIRYPNDHCQKITRAGYITLIAFPWVFSAMYAIIEISVMSHNINYGEPNNTTPYCYQLSRFHSDHAIYIVRALLFVILPMLMSLVCAITVLVLWCCYKSNHSMRSNYSMMDEAVQGNVRNSVIAVAVLNILFLPVCFLETTLHIFSFALMSLFGLIEGIMWICTIIEVRNKFLGLFQCCCPEKTDQPPSVQYSAKDTAIPDADG